MFCVAYMVHINTELYEEVPMSTSVLVLVIIILYVIGAIFVGLPLARKSIDVWRMGTKYRRFEGQDANYTGGFWGFVLFPLSAMSERVGSRASAPLALRFIGLGTRRRSDLYVITTMVLWLPRLLFNAFSFFLFTTCGFFLLVLDRMCPRCGDVVTTFVRTHITRVERNKRS